MGAALAATRLHRYFYSAAFAAGGLLLLTQSLFSHANGTQDTIASTAGDWLHLVGVVLWIGGLAQFINVIPPVRKHFEPQTLAVLVGHFSNYARIAVAAILVTGLYSAWLLVGTLDGLFTTVYGRALLVKIILIMPLLSIGAVNLLVTHQALQAGKALWGARLRTLVITEFALAAAVMVLVGIMTAIEPARSITAQREAAQFTPEPNPYHNSVYVEESQMHVDLDISPGWVGENDFKLRVYTDSNEPITDVSLIRMRFESLDEDIGESELHPEQQDDGVYLASGANLGLPGAWRIRVTLQRPGQYDTVVDFPTYAQAAPSPNINPVPSREMRVFFLIITGSFLALSGFFATDLSRHWNRSRVLAGALMVVGIIFIFYGYRDILPMIRTQKTDNISVSQQQGTPLPPPVQPDAASIEAGRAVYAQQCVSCHGTEGRGDGPIGLTLNPRPSDLTVHAVVGVHTDEELFDWISNGYPGSAMPAFASRLSETDRWNLVNYIRTLAPSQ
jgi:copper transport protein